MKVFKKLSGLRAKTPRTAVYYADHPRRDVDCRTLDVRRNFVESITDQRAQDPNIVEVDTIPVHDPIKFAGHMRVLIDMQENQFENILRIAHLVRTFRRAHWYGQ